MIVHNLVYNIVCYIVHIAEIERVTICCTHFSKLYKIARHCTQNCAGPRRGPAEAAAATAVATARLLRYYYHDIWASVRRL